MGILELVLIAVGLSMDAFAVSVCKGLAMERATVKNGVIVGLWFGVFQGLMPLLGYFLGAAFGVYIVAVDHWIAFVLLAIIGGKMIYESFQNGEEEKKGSASLSVSLMLGLAVATSIDAFAVGITFALLPSVNILLAVGLIGLITFLLSAMGVWVGRIFGGTGTWAERLGGLILIGIGVKILLEHLQILG